jgi:hypothetical protein
MNWWMRNINLQKGKTGVKKVSCELKIFIIQIIIIIIVIIIQWSNNPRVTMATSKVRLQISLSHDSPFHPLTIKNNK